MTILVTGGTGFLGTYLVDRLACEGHVVRVLDQYLPSHNGKEKGNRSVEFLAGDIRDEALVRQACEGVETVFHLAALPSIARGNAALYESINVGGTRNVLERAKACGARKTVYVSSSTVYGVPAHFPCREENSLQPIGPYGRSKVKAETLCMSFADRGFSVSIIRPRVIIGAGRIGIFSILFDRIRSNQTVYILGNGKNIFQLTHVSDMVEGCVLASRVPSSDIFNIGSTILYPIREELEGLIRHARSRSRIASIPPRLGRTLLRAALRLGVSPLVEEQFTIADRNFRLDTTKAERLLGWIPRKSNVEALIESFDWYVGHPEEIGQQYRGLFNLFGRFNHHRLGAFQSR